MSKGSSKNTGGDLSTRAERIRNKLAAHNQFMDVRRFNPDNVGFVTIAVVGDSGIGKVGFYGLYLVGEGMRLIK